MTENIKIKQGVATMSKSFSDGTEEEDKEIVTEGTYTEPTANVGISYGYTKNLGNYNSMKIQVSLNLPCYTKEIDAICGFAQDWVNKKMVALQEEINS